ncbi:enoyl-CoA hydratase/isomerase family protein [Nitriliruptoraceae bacterium ZYF776]|nr:enoyl-CoA hydratase/isomerase family protein [Profundirhabdus halotolerans]
MLRSYPSSTPRSGHVAPRTLRHDRNDVVVLTLHQPARRNPLDAATVGELHAHLDAAEEEDAKGLVLTGTPPAFCAGGDVGEVMPGDNPRALVARHRAFVDLARRLASLPLPTAAAVNGPAVGAGLSLALLCDHVVVSEEAIVRFGFLQVGLAPDLLAAATVQRRAGLTVANDVLLSGRPVAGAEAVALRLADRAVPSAEVVDSAVDWATAIGAIDPFAFQTAKAMIRRPVADLAVLADHEALAVGLAASSETFLTATSRFRSAPDRHDEAGR